MLNNILNVFRYLINTFFLIVPFYLLAVAELGYSSSQKQNAKIDQVLDMLEQKLLSPDNSMDLPQEFPKEQKDAGKKPGTISFSNPAKVQGNPPEVIEMEIIEREIEQLENQVNKLGSNVHSLRQNLVFDIKIDSYVELAARLLPDPQSRLRSITVKINDTLVYSLSETSLLWNNSDFLPLYAGPLKAGSHRISVQARVSLIGTDSSLPLSSSNQISTSKSFDLHIPPGSLENRYIIELQAPQAPSNPLSIQLIEPPA